MRVLKNKLLFNLKYFGFWLGYFFLARLFFVIYNHNFLERLSLKETLAVFQYGFRLDLSVAAYVSTIPFLLVCITTFFKTRAIASIHKGFTYVFVLVLNILLAIDVFLYPAWNTRLNATFLKYLNTPDLVFASATTVQTISFFVLIIVLTFVCIKAAKFLIYKKPLGFSEKPLLEALFLVLVTGLLILPMRGGLQTIPINQSNVYFSKNMFANHAAVNYTWNFMHSLTNYIDKDNHPFEAFEADEAATIFDTLRTPLLKKDSLANSILKVEKPNIILIIWESFTAKVVGPLGGNPLVTPNFNQLAEEGLLFNNFYANGDRTDKGLVSLLSGYYPQPNKSIIKIPEKSKKLKLISQTTKRMGYKNAFYYGGEINFANMNTYLFGSDIDQIYGGEIFPKKDRNSKWGAHDHVFFRHVAKDMKQQKAEPFFTTLLTLTSHEPYEFPGVYQFGKKTETDKLMSSMYYTDKALGDFIAFAKQQNWWDNTLVIIVADHGHSLPYRNDLTFNTPSRYKIPMLWLGGALAQKGVVPTLGSQVDLSFTLVDLLGGDTRDFPFGAHLFSQNKKRFVYYGFNGGFGYIDDLGYIVYDFVKGDVIESDGAAIEPKKDKGKAILQVMYQDFLDK